MLVDLWLVATNARVRDCGVGEIMQLEMPQMKSGRKASLVHWLTK